MDNYLIVKGPSLSVTTSFSSIAKHFQIGSDWSIALIIFVLLVSLNACSNTTLSSNDVGFVETKFIDNDGSIHTYLVFVPYDYEPTQKRPLILFLNGKGENGVDGYWTIHNNFGVELWEMKRRFPFICAIPQCPDEAGWSKSNLQRALDFADEVALKYGTDADRFYITGISQGGQGVWNAISQSPERFAAAAPLCGIPNISAKTLAESKLPIWNFYNDGDSSELVEANQQMRLDLLEAGSSPLFTQYKADGHNCWDRAYRSKALYEWLLANQRDSTRRQQSTFRLISPEEIVEHWRSTEQGRWLITDEGITASPDSDSSRNELLVSDRAYENFDWHVDAKFGTTCSRCRLVLMTQAKDNNTKPSQTIEVVLPLAANGIGGVRLMGGEWLAYLDPLAQRQLQTSYSNDIRVSLRSGKLSIHINGCLAVDAVPLDKIQQQNTKYFPSFVAQPNLKWQYCRLRVVE